MTNDELQSTFLAFREECIWLRQCYDMDAALFESGPDVKRTLKKTAGSFFDDLSRILSEYFLQLVGKITDPAKTTTKTGNRDNLTVAYMGSLLVEGGLMTDNTKRLSEDLQKYRHLIVEGRNKLGSHLDKESVLKSDPIGAHTKAEMDAFMENLQQYCDAVGRTVGVGPLDFRVSSGPSDALDLIGALQEHVDAQDGSAPRP